MLDGQNLVDAVVLEDAVELLADLVQQVYVQLVVQKAVDLQDVAGTNLPSCIIRSSKSFICDDAPFTNSVSLYYDKLWRILQALYPKKSY